MHTGALNVVQHLNGRKTWNSVQMIISGEYVPSNCLSSKELVKLPAASPNRALEWAARLAPPYGRAPLLEQMHHLGFTPLLHITPYNITNWLESLLSFERSA